MEELIRITEQSGKQAVSARELHVFLGNKKQFSDWIKDRIKKYGLVENQDYASYSLNSEKGRPFIEYALTLDTAKELAMVEGNAKGKEARQYFIACEKKLKQVSQFQIPSTLSAALRLAADQADIIENQKQLISSKDESISELTPKAEYTEKVLSSNNTISITQIAKDYNLSGRALNQKLHLMGIIYRVNNQWVLYKKHEGKGYTKSITYCDDYGKSYLRTEWTQNGRQFIDSLIRI